MQSLLKEAYDNYAAIYLLLLDRVHQHRSSLQSERPAWLEHSRRRPSSIADSALQRSTSRPSGKCSPIPVHSQSLFAQLPPSIHVEPILPAIGSTSFRDSSVFQSRPHHGRQLPPLPNESLPIQPQAYFYSMQGLSNRLGLASLSQDADGGSSYVSPPFRESEGVVASPTAAMAGKAYREGETGGSTSIDEGVELDICDSESGSIVGHQRTIPGGLQGLKSASQQSETFGSVTSSESSTFESFESQLEPDMCESLSSVSQASISCGRPLILPPGTGPQRNFLTAGQTAKGGAAKEGMDRRNTRSPIAFREGRRASDGLMTQGLIAFRQRLIETEKAKGITELNSVQKEHQALTSHYQWVATSEEASRQQEQHSQYCHEWRHSYTGADELGRSSFTRQRVSLPDKLCGTTQKTLYSKDSSKDADVAAAGAVKPLQQQLFQHRLQQKRQIFQKQAVFPRQSYPLSGPDLSRRQMVRQASYKMAQQQPVLPPLPVDLSAAHLLGELVCQPIAEDGVIPEHGEDDDQEEEEVEEEQSQDASGYWSDGSGSVVYQVANPSLWVGDLFSNMHLNLSTSTEPNFEPNLQKTLLHPDLQSAYQSSSQTLQNLPSSFAACQISDGPPVSHATQSEEQTTPILTPQPSQVELTQSQPPGHPIHLPQSTSSSIEQPNDQMGHQLELHIPQQLSSSLEPEQLPSSTPTAQHHPQLQRQPSQQHPMAAYDTRHCLGLQGWHGSSLLQVMNFGGRSRMKTWREKVVLDIALYHTICFYFLVCL